MSERRKELLGRAERAENFYSILLEAQNTLNRRLAEVEKENKALKKQLKESAATSAFFSIFGATNNN